MSENLTREALQQELWNMLPDSCKKIMDCLKETYIESLMADIDSYCQGQKQGPIWVKASERLPGVKTRVKWRLDKVQSERKYSLLEMTGPLVDLYEYEWYDESGCEAKKALEG